LAAQTGLYRSMLAGKRVLVLLDNALDVEQVRPLLPGSAGCVVLVTSRGQLTGLVTADGARSLRVGLVSEDEARELLAGRLGADRVYAEPHAVNEIIARCARLPLGLALAAARGEACPELPLASLAAELGATADSLDGFEAADAATDVRTVFSWSYRALSPDAARLFRLLGAHPGPHIAPSAAASLAAHPPRRVREMLTSLTRAHLVVEYVPGRYTMHDLLRAYAIERGQAEDSEVVRREAVQRALDHYLHTAYPAGQLLFPQQHKPMDLGTTLPGVLPESLTGHDDALAWFTAEYPVLLAAVQRAPVAGFDTHAWQLALALRTFQHMRGHWQEQIASHQTALDAARRLGDRTAQAHTLHGLGHAYLMLGRFDDAETHFGRAVEAWDGRDDPAGKAMTHMGLGQIAEQQGHYAAMLEHALQGLDLFRAAGNRSWIAVALNAIGHCHARLGDYDQALDYCQQALTLLQELGVRYGEATTWDSLGYVHRGLADYAQSATSYRHAVDLYRDLGDRYFEADSLTGLGDTHHAAGDTDAARAVWQQALDIFDQLDHPDASQVRAKLRA
jgi:tetratricopeptide (TPR) repeat protein